MASQTLQSENNIDQIRELIFGPTMRDYERRFEALQKQIQALEANFEAKFDKLQKALADQSVDSEKGLAKLEKRLLDFQKESRDALASLKADLLEKINLLQNDKTDRLQLANFLSEVALRLKGNDILQELTEQVDAEK